VRVPISSGSTNALSRQLMGMNQVSDILGHKDISTTTIHTKRSGIELAEAFFRPKRSSGQNLFA